MYIVHPFLYSSHCNPVCRLEFSSTDKVSLENIRKSVFYDVCVCASCSLLWRIDCISTDCLGKQNRYDRSWNVVSVLLLVLRSFSRKVNREIDKFNTNETNEECITKAKNETESKPNEKKYIQNFLFATFLSQVVWFVSKLAITETVVVDFNKWHCLYESKPRKKPTYEPKQQILSTFS